MDTIKFYRGEENGIVKERGEYAQSIFSEQYVQSLKILEGLIEKMGTDKATVIGSDFKEMEDWAPNLVAFCGDRGEGKTSCMSTVLDILRSKAVQNEQSRYLQSNEVSAPLLNQARLKCLPMVNPAFFDHNHNVIELLLGQMYSDFKECRSNSRNRDSLVEEFQIAKMCLKHLDKSKREMYDVIEELDALSAGVMLRRTLARLFHKYLEFVDADYLVISIDDLDLNMNEAYVMSEQIRKYLCNPFCLVLISVKVDQLMEVVENTIKAELTDDSLVNVRDMSVKYVEKLLPAASRVNMPKVYDLCNYPLEIYRNREAEAPLYPQFPSIRDCVVRMIFTKTRYLFYNAKGSISPIVPNNLRALRHVIGMLDNLSDFIDNDETPSNKRVFKQYFYHSWTKSLTAEYQKIASRLVHNGDIMQTNKLIVEFLATLFTDKKEFENNPSQMIANITSKANYGFNQSTGDVFYLLNILERNTSDEDVQQLLFFIKSYYSIQLYDRYDDMSEGPMDAMYPKPVLEVTGEVFKSDKWFNQTNILQRLVNGSYFTYEETEMLRKSLEGRKRDLTIVYGDKLKDLYLKIRNAIAHNNFAELEASEEFRKDFRLLEFFFMHIGRRIVDDTTPISRDYYRSMPIPAHLQAFNPRIGFYLFDILGSFNAVINLNFAYNRFGSNINLFDIAYNHKWTLLGRMMKLVQLKEVQDSNPEAKEADLPAIESAEERKKALYRLISNASIRNAEVISAMTESMRFRVESLKSTSDRKELLREFYSSIINSDMRTYPKNATSKQYIIKFGYLEAFRELLSQMDSETFESYFNRTISDDEAQENIIKQLFATVFAEIKSWKKGATLKRLLSNLQAYQEVPAETWEATIGDDEKLTKEMLIEKLKAIKQWTL